MLLDRDATRQHRKEAEGREGTSGEERDGPADLPTTVLHGSSVISWVILAGYSTAGGHSGGASGSKRLHLNQAAPPIKKQTNPDFSSIINV